MVPANIVIQIVLFLLFYWYMITNIVSYNSDPPWIEIDQSSPNEYHVIVSNYIWPSMDWGDTFETTVSKSILQHWWSNSPPEFAKKQIFVNGNKIKPKHKSIRHDNDGSPSGMIWPHRNFWIVRLNPPGNFQPNQIGVSAQVVANIWEWSLNEPAYIGMFVTDAKCKLIQHPTSKCAIQRVSGIQKSPYLHCWCDWCIDPPLAQKGDCPMYLVRNYKLIKGDKIGKNTIINYVPLVTIFLMVTVLFYCVKLSAENSGFS